MENDGLEKTILIIKYSLTLGGAERFTTYIANYLQQRGWNVNLILLSSSDMPIEYPLDNDVEVVFLNTTLQNKPGILKPFFFINRVFQRFFLLRKHIRRIKPVSILAVQNTVSAITIVSSLGLSIPVIASERNNPDRNKLPFHSRLFWKKLLKKSSVVVTLYSEAVDFYHNLGVNKVVVIPNPILQPVPVHEHENIILPEAPFLLSIGRIVSQKNFPLLIEAFAKLSGNFPNWKLVIVGDGQEFSHVKQLVNNFRLSEKIILPGKIINVMKYYEAADIYISTSDYEGFPMTIGEAISCHLPVIATKSSGAIHQLVQDGVTGMIVPIKDQPALSEAMEKLMSDSLLRKQFSDATDRIIENFSYDTIMKKWETLILELIHQNDMIPRN